MRPHLFADNLHQESPVTHITTAFTTALLLGLAACSNPIHKPSDAAAPQTSASPTLPSPRPITTATSEPITTAPETSPCPDTMVYIDHLYCPRLKWRCIKRARVNGILRKNTCKIYHPEPICLSESLRRQRFCIDKYEYPNIEGAHPPVMVNAFDAAALCEEQGKRLCWESEWTAACEGAPSKPYPYGLERDAQRCNIDKRGRDIDPDSLRSDDLEVRVATLERLDQSVPSGALPGCKSDYGVFDLTGNLSEWVFIEKPGGQCTWAGVKGGHWNNARNACRPTGKAHPEAWTFYPLSFRCCSSPDQGSLTRSGTDLMEWTPPATPQISQGSGPVNRGWPLHHDQPSGSQLTPTP